MIQEEKDLLLKDLCTRLPYGVKISVNDKVESLQGINILENAVEYGSFLISDIEEVKPYLFPLSSMTEEQKIIYGDLCYQIINATPFEIQNCFDELYDWLNKNYFDYNNLIPMGLANDATNLNIY